MKRLVLAHAGRAAVVLGGGPSLPEQFKRCPSYALRLSANHHGQLLTKCDYIVAQETIETSFQLFKSFGVPVINPREDADFRIECPKLPISGMEAARAAWVMGCAPIILAGMDCYQQRVDYWHRPDFLDHYGRDEPGPPRKLDKQLRIWRELEASLPGVMFRPIGGPLTQIFPRYRPDEPIKATPAAADILGRIC